MNEAIELKEGLAGRGLVERTGDQQNAGKSKKLWIILVTVIVVVIGAIIGGLVIGVMLSEEKPRNADSPISPAIIEQNEKCDSSCKG